MPYNTYTQNLRHYRLDLRGHSLPDAPEGAVFVMNRGLADAEQRQLELGAEIDAYVFLADSLRKPSVIIWEGLAVGGFLDGATKVGLAILPLGAFGVAPLVEVPTAAASEVTVTGLEYLSLESPFPFVACKAYAVPFTVDGVQLRAIFSAVGVSEVTGALQFSIERGGMLTKTVPVPVTITRRA